MTVKEFCEKIEGTFIAGKTGADNVITGGYTCDLLSFVIGTAKGGDCWITVMGNINVIAVGTLADVACVLLCEGATLDNNAKEKAELMEFPVISSEKSAYDLCVTLSGLI